MNDLFCNDYNEWTRENKDVFWRHYTRHNFYEFYTSEGYKTLLNFVVEFQPFSVLDYGCGHNDISDLLPQYIECVNYDPYVPKYSEHPNAKGDEQFDMIFCCGVLNCVETDCLDNVIKDLFSLTKKHGHVVLNVFEGSVYNRPLDIYINKIRTSNLFNICDQYTDRITTTVLKVNSQLKLRKTENSQTALFMLLEAK
jgi:hypothetical protein